MGTDTSIELLLDDETDEVIRAEWRALATAGLSSLGAHTAASNRPHVTLLVRDALPGISFTQAAELLPLALRLGAPIVFRHGDRGVLARPVEPSAGLRGLHRAVHDAAGSGEDAPYTSADDWIPHVTLARRLLLDRLPDALALLGAEVEGTGVAIRRWDAASRTVTLLS